MWVFRLAGKNYTYYNPLQSWWYDLWSDLAWHCSACCHGATVAETTWGLAFCSQHVLVWHRLTARTKRAFRQMFHSLLHSHWRGGPGKCMRSFREVTKEECHRCSWSCLRHWALIASWFNSMSSATGCNWDLLDLSLKPVSTIFSSLLFVRSHRNIRRSQHASPGCKQPMHLSPAVTQGRCTGSRNVTPSK